MSAIHPGEQDSYDIVILGSGCAGLATALFAALFGARVLVVERSPAVGGTTATSAGSVWIPGSLHDGSVNGYHQGAAKQYLMAAAGRNANEGMIDAFLNWGPKAIDLLEAKTDVHFRPYPFHPDYLSSLPGAATSGRALEPLPFDGRELGSFFEKLRQPIPEFTIFGGMMVDRTDINHLLTARRSFKSLVHAAKIVLRHGLDRIGHNRGTRLVMGNALIGRLLRSIASHDVTVWVDARVESIGREASGMRLAVTKPDGERLVIAKKAVVLATGGKNRDPDVRASLPSDAGILTPGPHLSDMSGPSGQRLAAALGADLDPLTVSGLFWAPVSRNKRRDGSEGIFPHFVFDRAKPGTFVVNEQGSRYLNESLSYNRFGLAMIDEHRSRPAAATYLVADAAAVRKYGIGIVRPGGIGLSEALRSKYLQKATTLAELAATVGIDGARLQDTVARLNRFAETGVDEDFHRGESLYERNLGDPTFGPNPSLRPIKDGPFYALRLYPGDIAANAGLTTDAFGQVMSDGKAIDGLYAVGNDMNSVMGTSYPGPGVTLGAAIAFAYAAACHATGNAA